jgi:peptidoglycan/LPS O-acetylase OafA/YrhL
VLSGYIIAYRYLGTLPWSRLDFRDFLVRRLARIYPLQLVTLLLAIAMIVVAVSIGITVPSPDNFTVWGAVQDLLLIRGWEPFPHQGWNFPAWSLSAEWFAYLLFPAIALFIGVVRRRRLGLLLVLAGCLVLEGLGALLLPSFNGMPHPLLRVLAGFVAGVAIFAIGRPRVRPGFLTVIGVISLALLITTAGRIGSDPVRAMVALVLSGGIVIGLAHGAGPAIRWLSSRPLEYGGRISYGVYMIHGIVLMIGGALLAVLVQRVPQATFLQWPIAARVGILLVPLILVLVLGAALYHLVERPAQGWIGRLAKGSRTGAAGPTSPGATSAGATSPERAQLSERDSG